MPHRVAEPDTIGAPASAAPPVPPRMVLRSRRGKARRLRRALLYVAAALVALFVSGYLLVMRHSDPANARAVVEAELRESVLDEGEVVERRVNVTQRKWWDYFRSTHGVLAVTDRRILFVGLPPSERVSGELVPMGVEVVEAPMDSAATLVPTRVLLGTARGVALGVGSRRERFAIAAEERTRFESLLRHVSARQESQRVAARLDVEARRAAEAKAREPVYYVVRRQDQIATIARRYNTTPERILEWNARSTAKIRVGETLLVKPRT